MPTRSKVVANKRLLVANRGEIAIRIFRAASELNMVTVAMYAFEDRFAMHRFKADEAYLVGKVGNPVGAYLDWHGIIEMAKAKKVDAIHPGYGFLSENAAFARACEEAGIMFCGPSPAVLDMFGDKVKARQVAQKAGIPIIPGTYEPIPDLATARRLAQDFGYPVVLKAVAGGGGKGIRKVASEAELTEGFSRAQGEALASFGRADIYLEKAIEQAKHIEVQIVGDAQGNMLHLYDRDCSIQRRNQKVIEIAPALNIPESTRRELFQHAVTIGKEANYIGVGTVEFLVDSKGQAYFLEVNPRIQVEHTVTEMVTNFDIVQASIMLAAGRSLSHPAINVKNQDSITCRGVAIQCRITTEDPARDFAPDTGKILAYRPAQGFGIRLDEGMATQGGVVTPHYDSLLVKVTAHAVDMKGAVNKMRRALGEFRIRGVRTNVPLLMNIMADEAFGKGKFTTTFLHERADLFKFPPPMDRATKMLRFIADVTINNPHQLASKITIPTPPICPLEVSAADKIAIPPAGGRQVFLQQGVQGLVRWIKARQELLLTDTTMRDAHQSLFATRLRTVDILGALDFYRWKLPGLFSLEVWGGATFDTSLRFLREDPWERLALVREKVPNILLQMLLRGDNAVGYTNYPQWVIRDFIRLTKQSGLDIFRIFDCLNNPEQMAVAIDEVKKQGGIVEASIGYTGNIVDPRKTKYSLKYYLNVAKELVAMGTDILCIKDMAGLLRPDAAELLIKTLKEEVDVPIHLHTHATSGNSEAMLLAAAKVGCDIVDGAVSSMSGLTSQPSLNALVASLEFSEHKTAVDLNHLDKLSLYWQGVRGLYHAFETNVRSTTTRVYEHEIPGGQYSNLFDQARQVGVSAQEFEQITERYREVNELFGDIVKVTPSSKVVGDMALLLHKNKLTGPQWLKNEARLDYPDSVRSFYLGHMGIPLGGFPTEVRSKILGEDPPPPCKPTVEDGDNLAQLTAKLYEQTGVEMSERHVMSYRLYPKVFLEAFTHHKTYGAVDSLPTKAFFYGLQPGQEIAVDLELGKTLYISLDGMSEPDEQGMRKVFFQLNGFPREISIADQSAAGSAQRRPKADPLNPRHIMAPMPGKIISASATTGQKIAKGATLLVLEAMKMEYAITAKTDGTVKDLQVVPGERVEEGDLLLVMS